MPLRARRRKRGETRCRSVLTSTMHCHRHRAGRAHTIVETPPAVAMVTPSATRNKSLSPGLFPRPRQQLGRFRVTPESVMMSPRAECRYRACACGALGRACNLNGRDCETSALEHRPRPLRTACQRCHTRWHTLPEAPHDASTARSVPTLRNLLVPGEDTEVFRLAIFFQAQTTDITPPPGEIGRAARSPRARAERHHAPE